MKFNVFAEYSKDRGLLVWNTELHNSNAGYSNIIIQLNKIFESTTRRYLKGKNINYSHICGYFLN